MRKSHTNYFYIMCSIETFVVKKPRVIKKINKDAQLLNKE